MTKRLQTKRKGEGGVKHLLSSVEIFDELGLGAGATHVHAHVLVPLHYGDSCLERKHSVHYPIAAHLLIVVYLSILLVSLLNFILY